jgi:acetylornithine deacetylase/succinyl-diaminopimelate desuccinylase-like protein
VLFYGHYDVQPVDPVDAWTTPPFSPTEFDGRIRARGAQDNKGQHFYAIKAMEALVRENRLNRTVKVILEGEEECGSDGITASLSEWQDFLQADILMVTDLAMHTLRQPAITLGLRGIVDVTVELSGPGTDLHSGMHGGLAPNPATEMARLIASLHHNSGAIAIDGFYDPVLPLSDKEQELVASVPFDEAEYERLSGVPPVAGEDGLPARVRLGFRPCLDVNGMHSGFDGPGVKTIIPSRARAKLTARLAAGQEPQAAVDAIAAHLEAHKPAGLKLDITEKGASGAGFRLDPESSSIDTAREVLRDICEEEAALTWEGASIPIIADLARVSGAEPLLIGFGLEEDCIHAPNESFSIEQFKRGYMYVYAMLCRL